MKHLLHKSPAAACLVLALTACQTAEQPAAGTEYTGSVTAVGETSITLSTDTGDVTIPLSEQTRFERAGAPQGDAAQPPEKPEDDSMAQPPRQQTLTAADLAVGDEVTVTVGADGSAATVTLAGGAPGAQTVESYAAAVEYTSDAQESGRTVASTGTDENAVHVYGGANVTLTDSTLSRSSADSKGGDTSSFYGVGAAALVTDGTLTLEGGSIDTDAGGGAGVFAYGDGTAYVTDTSIATRQGTSGGIHVAGGGTLYARDLTVDTRGESSAAIRSDRGGGTLVADGGSYTSHGSGSPAVYSTADITVHGAQLAATGSEAVCIEGSNTLRLFDCDLTGNMADPDQNDCTWNVILYQSMSGDAQEGNSRFEMTGGTLTARNGGMFYTTNTQSTFVLSGVDVQNAADSPFLLKCTGNANQRGWGAQGANGADCTFTGIGQTLEGDVIWDSISRLQMYLTRGSTLTGAFVDDESCAGQGGDGSAALYVDENSTWRVTGDSTLSSLCCAGTLVGADGSAVTVADTAGNVLVQGDGVYTVTVGHYSTEADVSGASDVSDWSDWAF